MTTCGCNFVNVPLICAVCVFFLGKRRQQSEPAGVWLVSPEQENAASCQ